MPFLLRIYRDPPPAITPTGFMAVFLFQTISITPWQLMSKTGHHMYMVIDIATKLLIISFEEVGF